MFCSDVWKLSCAVLFHIKLNAGLFNDDVTVNKHVSDIWSRYTDNKRISAGKNNI